MHKPQYRDKMNTLINANAKFFFNRTNSLICKLNFESSKATPSNPKILGVASITLNSLAMYYEKKYLSSKKNFLSAVESGSLWRVKLFSSAGINVNQQRPDGTTALMLAARYGHTEIAQSLLATNSINVNQQDSRGITALMFATRHGRVEIVRALLAVNNININQQDNLGWTALMFAAHNGHTETIQTLLATAGINVNQQDNDGWTALMYTALRGRIETAHLFLTTDGISVNQRENKGKTALMIAILYGNTKAAQEQFSLSTISEDNLFGCLKILLDKNGKDHALLSKVIKKLRLLGNLKLNSTNICHYAGIIYPEQIEIVRNECNRQIKLETILRGYGQIKKEFQLPQDAMNLIDKFVI